MDALLENLVSLSDSVNNLIEQSRNLNSRLLENPNSISPPEEKSLEKALDCIRNSSSNLHDAGEIVSSLLGGLARVPWVGHSLKNLDMEYLSGGDPWKFSLKYTTADAEIDNIHRQLNSAFKDGKLEPYATSPEEGSFVVCRESKKFYRAFVRKFNLKSKRLHVTKIDVGEDSFIGIGDTFCIPFDVCTTPCQTMNCCLNVEDLYLKEIWCSTLEAMFRKFLREYVLTVDVKMKLDNYCLPTFLVGIHVYNEALMEEKNFGTWVNDTLLSKLKEATNGDLLESLGEDCFDPFYKSNVCTNGESERGNDEVEEISQSFLSRIAMNGHTGEKENHAGNNDQFPRTIEQLVDEPDPQSINRSCVKVENWIRNYSDEKAMKAHREAGPQPIEEPSFASRKSESRPPSVVNKELGGSMTNSPVKAGSLKQSNCSSVENTKLQAVSSLDKSSVRVDAPEFIPNGFVVFPQEGDDSNIITNLEDEYMPQDEKRRCFLFDKKGYCYRSGCNKEHKKKSTVWTEDKLLVYQKMFHTIDLPRESSEIHMKIEHVVYGNAFYATLPDYYSDINEEGHLETLDSLHNDLNEMTNASAHPLLMTVPAISEMVLALGLQRSLGPKKKWLRAVVIDKWDDDKVEVFFADFGNKEIVNLNEIRMIRPQFLHLPRQAVYTRLDSILPVKGKEKEARAYLEKLIKGKILKCKIIARNITESELDVVLFGPEGDAVNNHMVACSLCYPV